MPNFDGTIDNRWRPDLESSQRRVREEERAEVVHSPPRAGLGHTATGMRTPEGVRTSLWVAMREVLERLWRSPHLRQAARPMDEVA